MAKRKLRPRALTDRLDAILPPGRADWPATDDDPLVDLVRRLSAAPPPDPITPEAKARIRTQVVQAYRQQGTSRTRRVFPVVSMPGRIGVGIAVLAVLIVALILVRALSDTLNSASHITTQPILTAAPASDSPLPASIVIEGVVEALHADTITVFGIDIGVAPTDSTLAKIRVGDRVRVEGELVTSGETMTFVATSITVVDRQFGAIDQSNGQPFQLQPGPPIVIPSGCTITGLDDGQPQLTCPED